MVVRAVCAVLVGLLCISAACPVRADAAGSAPATLELDARLSAELEASLRDEAESAFTWRVTWTSINGAVMVASIVGAFVLPRSQRPSSIIGAISAAVGTGFTWFLPLAVEADAESAAQLDSLPAQQRRARLQQLYTHSAEDEQDRIEWPWHAVSVLAALVPGMIIWLGYGQLGEGALSFATGLVLGELALLTQPTGLMDPSEHPSGSLRVAFTGGGAFCSYTVAF
jgi:hypothetical protein